jgi:hypothetical protein
LLSDKRVITPIQYSFPHEIVSHSYQLILLSVLNSCTFLASIIEPANISLPKCALSRRVLCELSTQRCGRSNNKKWRSERQDVKWKLHFALCSSIIDYMYSLMGVSSVVLRRA